MSLLLFKFEVKFANAITYSLRRELKKYFNILEDVLIFFLAES